MTFTTVTPKTDDGKTVTYAFNNNKDDKHLNEDKVKRN